MIYDVYDGFLRLNDLINIPATPERVHIYKSGECKGQVRKLRARAATRGMIGVGKTTLWRWINAGTFPKPVKLSSGVTAWRSADIKKWLDEHSNQFDNLKHV